MSSPEQKSVQEESLENTKERHKAEIAPHLDIHPSAAMFSRLRNPVIFEQLVDLMYKGDRAKEQETISDPLMDGYGEFITDENGVILRSEPRLTNPDFKARTRYEIKEELIQQMVKVEAVTNIDYSGEVGNHANFQTRDHVIAPEDKDLLEAVDSEHLVTALAITEAHEKGHTVRNFNGVHLDEHFQRGFDLSKASFNIEAEKREGFLKKNVAMEAYLFSAPEIAERMSQLKNYFGISGDEYFTKQHLEYAREHYIEDTGLDNNMSDFFACITPEKEEDFLYIINNSGI